MAPTSSRFAVAVHTLTALGYLHREGLERVPSSLIAKSVNTNPVVIRNLVRALKKAGFVKSKEGKEGGVSLAIPPSKISLGEVFAAVESGGILGSNKNPEYKSCPVSCGMKKVLPPLFLEVENTVLELLKKKTLKQLLDQI